MTFTATVTITNGPNSGDAASGSVTFVDGPLVLGTVGLDASGRAPLPTPILAVGTHIITATYRGATGIAVSERR